MPMPSPSRVLIDGYFWGKPYGFGRYIEELVHSLHKLGTGPDIVVALPDRGTGQTLPPVETVTAPHRAFPLWEQLTVPDLARRAGAGLVHFPSNTAALRRRGLPALVTVHDLFFIDHPSQGGFKDKVYSRYSRTAFALATRRAERIVSVSEETGRRLARSGVDSVVVPNTVSHFVETGLALGDAPAPGVPYLVHRGGYEPHRNTARVLAAFRRLRAAHPEVELRVLGVPGGEAALGIGADERIACLPRLSEAEIVALYRGSLGVVAVALREGFGLPILEGFGFGTAVISSNRPPMTEVAGDAALLVDPEDEDAILAAMTALTDPATRDELVRRGTARYPAFSGARMAETYVELYRQLLAGHAGETR